MVLYADILFMINFSMDFLGQFICAKIMRYKASRTRLIISSLLGATYGVISVALKLNFFVSLTFCVLIALVMMFICFKVKNLMRLCTLTVMFIFISATLGGIMSVIYVFLNKVIALTPGNNSHVTYSGARTFVIVGLTFIISLIFGRILIKKKEEEFVEVIVNIKNREYVLKGLCDSGNLLVEPFSGKKVILVGENSEIGKAILSFNEYKYKYIPFKDLSGEGVLKGILPNEIKINGKPIDVIIAITKNNNFNGCEALVPKTVL